MKGMAVPSNRISRSSSGDWLNRSLAAVWHPCTQMRHHDPGAGEQYLPLLPIARGDGVWLYDFEGKRYLDGISSWWTNLFGHAHPRINAALKSQLETLEHVMLAGFTHPCAVELAERLSIRTDGALGHAFYASDGASATEIALKMSFHAWQNQGKCHKDRFLCLAGGYHGETVGALSVTDVPLFRDAYAPLVRQAGVVPSPDARQAESGEDACAVARRAIDGLEAALRENDGRIAALIVEPLVQCATGMAMYDPEYLRLARVLCDRYEVHLIFDEIAVGFGRTGSFFAHDQAGVRPDLLCLSKGISGGYLPLSAVLCRDEIYRAFYAKETGRGFLHSHSYTGNPLACRAALTVLDIFAEEDVLKKNQETARKLRMAFAPLASHSAVRHLRQKGMILAFDVASDDTAFAWRFYRAALAKNTLLRPIGNTVYVMPPYIVEDEHVAQLGYAAIEALQAAL
jgi:adenosylmethionine-8-amino-7-oxononanoate aminotransferase